MKEVFGWMYILTNNHNKVLYVGSTNYLRTRHWEHKTKRNPNAFTARYNVHKLVYYEEFAEYAEALVREKVVKRKLRSYKINLINSMNPEWKDLSEEFDSRGVS